MNYSKSTQSKSHVSVLVFTYIILLSCSSVVSLNMRKSEKDITGIINPASDSTHSITSPELTNFACKLFKHDFIQKLIKF